MNKPASELIALAMESLKPFRDMAEVIECSTHHNQSDSDEWNFEDCPVVKLGDLRKASKAWDALRTAAKSGSERAVVDALREALRNLRDANMRYSLVSNAKNARCLEQCMREADAALATPPAQPAPASGESSTSSDGGVEGHAPHGAPADASKSDVATIRGHASEGNGDVKEAGIKPGPSEVTHGKPDGAVREKRGIYIASKTKHADRWRFLRDRIGEPIISTWIDEAGEGQSADLDDLWRRCLSEATGCQVLIAYREPGEIFKGGWVEIGAALAAGIPVYAVGLDGFTISKYQGIAHFPDMKSAIAASRKVIAALHSPKIAAAETSPGDVGRTAPITCPNCHDESDCSNVDICNAVEAAYSSDVKAEAKSQEPDAVAVKPLEWGEEPDRPSECPAWNATSLFGATYRVFAAWNGSKNKWGYVYRDFHDTVEHAKVAAQADFEQRIRSALIHPTTKPETPAVSVDAIKDLVRSFHRNSCYPEAGTGELNAVATAIAALIAEGR